jgi:hypothetical protein
MKEKPSITLLSMQIINFNWLYIICIPPPQPQKIKLVMCNEDGMGHDFKLDRTPILLRKDQNQKVLETQRIGLRTELERVHQKN